jgi:cell division protein FtsI (penicillin-binding protein 3)
MSIGYSLQITPIHMLAFYNAVANEGVMVMPLFTMKTLKDGKVLSKNNKRIINPAICSKASIDEIKPYLIDVVDRGTAKLISNTNYKIAGKTGTTLLAYGDKNQQEVKKYQASFVGYFPADNPKYSCIVVVNNPKQNGFYGGNVAAPVFKEVSDKIFASDMSIHKSIRTKERIDELPILSQGKTEDAIQILDRVLVDYEPTDSKWMVPSNSNSQIKLSTRNIENDFKKGLMPNLYGMNLMDAVFLLENAGLDVVISGQGHVVSQSIRKGEMISNNQKINLIASL